MAALGRVELCGRCPRRPGCFWPRQFGKALEGRRSSSGPTPTSRGRRTSPPSWPAGPAARRVLTLVDEINFLATGFRRRVARGPIWSHLARVLGEVDSGRGCVPRRLVLATAPSCGPGAAACVHPDWRMPTFPIDWAVEVQARGWEAHHTRFRFLGHDLQQFGRSPLHSRERHANGDLSLAGGRPRRRCHLQRHGTARVPPVPPGPRPGLPVRRLPVRPPRDAHVQPREQARDACPFPRQRRSNPGLLRESGQPAVQRGAAALVDRQEMLRRVLLPYADLHARGDPPKRPCGS